MQKSKKQKHDSASATLLRGRLSIRFASAGQERETNQAKKENGR